MPKYLDIRLCTSVLLLGATLFAGGVDVHAQARRRGRAVPVAPRIDVREVLDSLKHQYANYQFTEASKSLAQLSKANPEDSIALYRERLERAERMLPKTEQLPLLYKVSGGWRKIDDLLKKYNSNRHTLAKFEFNDHNGAKYWVCNLLRADNSYCPLYYADEGDIGLRESSLENEDNSKLFEAINRADSQEDFPFVLSDGVRLIFGSNRSEGLGGYDLYMSRYNIERGAFLEPSLLPMPYNSPANDYLMVCDEELGRTFLVSDRDSKEGEVTLFVFEGLPDFVTAKKTSEVAELNEEHISQALLRQEARLKEDTSLVVKRGEEAEPIFIPLKAGAVIRSWEDFKSNEARELYKIYLEGERAMQGVVWQQEQAIEDMRAGTLTVEQAKAKCAEALREARELGKQQAKRLVELKNLEIKKRSKQ